MYKKIKPYMGEYLRYTRRSAVVITIAVILSVVPYFLLFQLINRLSYFKICVNINFAINKTSN